MDYDDAFSDMDTKSKHYLAFQQLFEYLLSHYNISLDKSGKDISRLCYMSSDPNIVIKGQVEAFPVKFIEYKKEVSQGKSPNHNVKAAHTE